MVDNFSIHRNDDVFPRDTSSYQQSKIDQYFNEGISCTGVGMFGSSPTDSLGAGVVDSVDIEYLSSVDILSDEWGELKYPTDGYGKKSWNPKPVSSEQISNRYGLQLAHAIYNRDLETINELLKYDINLEICDESGNNPIILAVGFKFKALIRFLLQRGVELEDTNDEGANVLHIACLNKDERLVYILLHNGCNPNATIRKTKDTPLHIACFAKNLNIIKMLVDRNVNLTAQNKKGKTPMDYLKESDERDIEVEKYLEDKIAEERRYILETQQKYSYSKKYFPNSLGASSNIKYYYDSESNSLLPYREDESLKRERAEDVIFDRKKWDYNARSHTRATEDDIESLFDGYRNDDENDIDIDFSDDTFTTSNVDKYEQEFFWGNESPSKRIDFSDINGNSNEDHDIIDLDEDEYPPLRINVFDDVDTNSLYFCKKCCQESLNISTGVCGNCHHIYGMFSACPWCEPGKIDGFGNCDNCDFKLYIQPSKQNFNVELEGEGGGDDDNINENEYICLCCGQDEHDKNDEYCKSCGYILGNRCNNCKVILVFDGDNEDLKADCWRCGNSLIDSR